MSGLRYFHQDTTIDSVEFINKFCENFKYYTKDEYTLCKIFSFVLDAVNKDRVKISYYIPADLLYIGFFKNNKIPKGIMLRNNNSLYGIPDKYITPEYKQLIDDYVKVLYGRI